MRYYSDIPYAKDTPFSRMYECPAHPVYRRCTLFERGGKGLAIIQQHYIQSVRFTWWGEVDPGIANRVYLHKDFQKKIFRKFAAPPDADGCYPTLTIRQVMWALRMKPISKERWETVFDRKPV